MRRTFRTIALATLILASFAATSVAAMAEPQLILPTRPVRATPNFFWRFPVKILNPLDYGLFVDSMWTVVKDLDPGVTGEPREVRIPLNLAMRSRPAISSGDSLIFAYSGNVVAESAQIVIHLHAHSGNGRKYQRSGRVDMIASQQVRQNPSRIVPIAGREIEMVTMNGTGGGLNSGPGVVIVHGDGSHARRMIPTAFNVVSMGFSVVLVSLPGYGLSAGPTEFAGPVTLAAIEAAIDTLRGMSGVDTTRLGLWGIGHGASAAALVGERHPELSAVVLTSGVYDLEAVERETRSTRMRELIRRDAGKDAVAWRARAPIERASSLRMPVLIVHSQIDTIAPFDQARAYEAALRSNGTKVSLAERLGAGRYSAPGTDDDPEFVFLRDRVQMRWVLGQ